MYHITLVVVSILVASFSANTPSHAQLIETTASWVHMIDASSGNALLSSDADKQFPPGSLAKVMTAETVFNALAAGRVYSDTTYPISEHAWRTGGAPSRTTTMFARVKSEVAVGDLLQGLTVQMANDAAIALAEGMAGSESDFAQLMNERAKAIGLENSHFINPTGFPSDGQLVTARDMTLLGKYIWQKHRYDFSLFSQPAFEWNKIFQRNKNPLLTMNLGADGFMTGFSEGHGYSILASASNGNRRVFITAGGFETEAQRISETAKLLRWGLDGFQQRDLLAHNEVISQASVYGGEKPTVGLRVEEKVSILSPITHPEAVKLRIVYDRPLPAPLAAGAEVGELEIWIGDTLSETVSLHAAETNAAGTLPQRAFGAVAELLVGWLRQFSWSS